MTTVVNDITTLIDPLFQEIERLRTMLRARDQEVTRLWNLNDAFQAEIERLRESS